MSSHVNKRETFYLAGYDPRGARYYYNLYKNEAAKQSLVNGMKISIDKKERIDTHIQTWNIHCSKENIQTETKYHYLEWDDIIRQDWKKNSLELFFDLFFYFKTYILAGRFSQYMKVSPYQMIGIFLPSVFIIISFFLASYIAYSAYIYIENISGLAVSVAVFCGTLYLLMKVGHHMAIFWLVRIFVFSARYAFDEHELLKTRLDEFYNYIQKYIKAAKENGTDEILFVSHSVGTILMIPLLEKILKGFDEKLDIKLSILVLGECIPLVSGIDKAIDYKEKMAYIAKSKHLFWLDYTTVIDGACFPQLNYFEDINIEISKKENFHFNSARFHTLFSKKKYNALRKNKYLTHFIYFMATEFSGNYDFFKMTAGNQYLYKSLGEIS